jgi:hypothetical protein
MSDNEVPVLMDDIDWLREKIAELKANIASGNVYDLVRSKRTLSDFENRLTFALSLKPPYANGLFVERPV